MRLALLFNRHAGALRGGDADQAAEDIAATFREAGHEVAVTLAEGESIRAAIRAAASAADYDAIVVGGGDGTVSFAAGAAAESGRALGILPLGTMNLFARSLAMPTDMKEAAAALARGEIRAIDIGKANGRVFVHTVGLGMHPAIVAEREKLSYGGRISKMLGSLRAWLRVLRSPRRYSLSIATDGQRTDIVTAGAVVTNNLLGKGHLPYADRLDGGVLGLYVTVARTPAELLRVTAAAATGTLADNPLVEYRQTTAVDITSRSRRGAPLTIDGELLRLTGSIHIEIVPGGLKVLAPKSSPTPSAE